MLINGIDVRTTLARCEKSGKIRLLKQRLAETDYKVIKSAEYQLAGLPLPYDIETLSAERQSIRDEINRLEGNA